VGSKLNEKARETGKPESVTARLEEIRAQVAEAREGAKG
jgi:hypothetical protein